MTCQNTGAKGVHKIGHVADFDAIALDTATHFAFREECMSCLRVSRDGGHRFRGIMGSHFA
jgi:hypothetical protein